VPDAISVAHLSGHERQLATRLLIDPHQSDVLGSAYDLLLSLDESGAGAFTHGPVDAWETGLSHWFVVLRLY
jgi:hypothetical protein